MDTSEPNTEILDVFLCHSSEDKSEVHVIAGKLAVHGIKTWLDLEQIRPGTM